MPFSIDTKEMILLSAGGVFGYLASLLVAKQTERNKNLVLEVVGREIVAEKVESCPFSIVTANGEQIDNVYLIVARVWNKGGIQVQGNEISPNAPLNIVISKSAKVLGDPVVIKPHREMEFNINEIEPNKYEISFDCLNPDEWVQVGFFITGDPRTPIKGTGRIFGQHVQFDITTDDSRATWYERITSLLAFLLIVSSPFSLAGAVWWAYTDYQLTDLVRNQEKLPELLKGMFAQGILVPMLAAFYFGSIWIKRKVNPKSYPIREDFQPTQWQSLKAFLLTAITGKSYQVSNSAYDYGEIKPKANSHNNQEAQKLSSDQCVAQVAKRNEEDAGKSNYDGK